MSNIKKSFFHKSEEKDEGVGEKGQNPKIAHLCFRLLFSIFSISLLY